LQIIAGLFGILFRGLTGTSPAGNLLKEHVFLGTDSGDAEALRDRWLSENPTIKVLRMHPPRREPLSLLVRLGGRNVPRVSITVDYEDALPTSLG
jgi:hypothetical protein